MTGQEASWTISPISSSAWSEETPSPTSATSGCSRAVTAPISLTSISRAITSWPRPATTWASSSSRSRRSLAIRTRRCRKSLSVLSIRGPRWWESEPHGRLKGAIDGRSVGRRIGGLGDRRARPPPPGRRPERAARPHPPRPLDRCRLGVGKDVVRGLALKESLELLLVDRLVFDKYCCDRVQLRLVFEEHLGGASVCVLDQTVDLLVDLLRHLLGVGGRGSELAPEKRLVRVGS